MLETNVKNYINKWNIYIKAKSIYYKSYDNLLSILILIHIKRNLFIDFVIKLLINKDQKKLYNSISIIVNYLIKIVYFKII